MRTVGIVAAGVALVLFASCVASWQWDWSPIVTRGFEADFRDAGAVCSVVAVNEVDGARLEPLILSELGFRESCDAQAVRYLKIEFRCAKGACRDCDPSVPSATGTLRVTGAGGAVSETVWTSRSCGRSAEEYAKSFAGAVRGFVLFGRDFPDRF